MTVVHLPRKQLRGIYQITCLPTGKRYIGSSMDIWGRWQYHRSWLRRNIHNNPRLQNAWNKYGESAFAFELLELCPRHLVLTREEVLLNHFSPELNISRTAIAPMTGRTHSAETREKMRRTHKRLAAENPELIQRMRAARGRGRLAKYLHEAPRPSPDTAHS